MNPLNEKTISLLKKLKELAERGVDGEKLTAQEKLSDLMGKYGITIEDLEGEKQSKRKFFVEPDYNVLFQHVLRNVCGRDRDIYCIQGDRKKAKELRVLMTDAEFIEVDAKFDHFKKAFDSEYEILIRAFIHKNRLYAKSDGNEVEREQPPLSLEERQQARKVAQMMEAIDRSNFHKQIGN